MLHSTDPDLQQAMPVQPGQQPIQYGTEADMFAGMVDYFGFDERKVWKLPDGKQWIQYKRLNEGDRAKFLKNTRSDVRIDRASGEARIPFDQSEERRQLLLAACTDWNMYRRTASGWVQVPFQNNGTPGCTFAQWINAADPMVLADLEKAIRRDNAWLLNDMTVEQIDKEIENLTELREQVAKREADEKNFTVKQ